MKKQLLNSILSIFGVFILLDANAYHDFDKKQGITKPSPNSQSQGFMAKSASCEPAAAQLTMDFNDVRALIEQGGSMFQDRQSGVSAYEVPKGSKLKVIFAGALWMGGTDVNGQLKLAALRFRQADDFWPGPLTVTAGTGNYDPRLPVTANVIRDYGDANISKEECEFYDKFYTIERAEVEQFSTWWECKNGLGENGCEEDVETPSADLVNRLNNWPAHGKVSLNQAYFLAPYYDRDKDGTYNVDAGDYPWYDDILGRDDVQCGIDRRITLFGDKTHWWVFNDKGNIHTETQGDPIGMEIRAQAFSFATDDEINKMTFYNYEMINRGTQTLFNTYFSQYVDPDIGFSEDDYVGCDVSRGLGFAYNGDEFDEGGNGNVAHGANPPAIGVDFFEGPYQDVDGIDNVGPHWRDSSGGIVIGTPDSTDVFYTPSVAEALANNGIVYKGIGLGYSDSIIDNERFGMRRFTYYTRNAPAERGDPTLALQYYNYMKGLWRFGNEMYYGGDGFSGGSLESDYMFPGDTDPLHWSTAGVNPGFDWSEESANNNKGDRRFVQSAGPFTLRPGAVNNITVGIVYGRGSSGARSSVEAMKIADTKAQALFDACFEILDPPSAPKLVIQELNKQLVLTLDNPITSNNYKEEYAEEDKINIVDPNVDRFYRFQGYQIFQLVDEDASITDIRDPNKARLVAQCDIEDSVSRVINYIFEESLGQSIPTEMVKGENKGIRHSFLLTEDAFAQGDKSLVNFKTYYYVAIAYAYNQFKEYNPQDPNSIDGQKRPYISSRLSYDGTSISPVSGIPHNPITESNGTIQKVSYGATPKITRIDGTGNGNRSLELTTASRNAIVSNGTLDEIEYDYGGGPINVKVVDPLNVLGGYYECKFLDYVPTQTNGADTASWVIYRYASKGSSQILDSASSDVTINVNNEQLIPKWGVSVTIQQKNYTLPELPATVSSTNIGGSIAGKITDLISSSISYADSSKPWLSGVQDNDAISFPTNWIRSGDNDTDQDAVTVGIQCNPNPNLPGWRQVCSYKDELYLDPNKQYVGIINGTIAPHRLTGYQAGYMPIAYYKFPNPKVARDRASISFLPSVDIVLTSDKSKWTRVPVIELGRRTALNVGNALPGGLRKSPSVDKDGNPDGSGDGMSWFPGYAIDVETGVRLYMAFGENSSMATNNGADMIWNPTTKLVDGVGNPIFGGQHSVMIWSYNNKLINDYSLSYNYPAYIPSEAENLNTHTLYQDFKNIVSTNSSTLKRNVYGSLAWVGYPMLRQNQQLLSTDAIIKIRVNKEYKNYEATNRNQGRPMYGWSMDDIGSVTNSSETLASALDLINVVPNPYYAYSQYERSRLETMVKVTNLPERCTVKIFSVNGKLIRTFKKDSPITYLDWDLKNSKGIGIAGGLYLIHVDVPDVGEKIVKFFGGMRAVDLQGI